MALLKKCRKGESQWRVFPFWYTLLALVEMDLPAAVAEMRYVAPRCESGPQAQRISQSVVYAPSRTGPAGIGQGLIFSYDADEITWQHRSALGQGEF